MQKLILASTSVYRRELLERLGLVFDCFAPEVDEEQIQNSGLPPLEISRQLSIEKASALKTSHPNALIIGGDQVLEFKGSCFGKPLNFENACQQLKKLQGQTHFLHTSYALCLNEDIFVQTVTAKMQMRRLDDKQIMRYLHKDEPYFCCGSYKLESYGIALFENVDCEDHTAIVGLPLIKLANELQRRGFNLL